MPIEATEGFHSFNLNKLGNIDIISINKTGSILIINPYIVQVFDMNGNLKNSFYDSSKSYFTIMYETNFHPSFQSNLFAFVNSTNDIKQQGGILVPINSTKLHSQSVFSVVSFTESGLPQQLGLCWPFWNCVQTWGITIDNHIYNSSTNIISFSIPSGTYLYSVIAPKNYSAIPSSGGLLVKGNTNQAITFQKHSLQ